MAWRLGIATGSCVDCPILDVLPALRASGVNGVELGTPQRHFDPWEAEQVEGVARYLHQNGIEAVSIHAPFGGALDLTHPDSHHRHAAIGAILTAASAIRHAGGRLIVVHPSDVERHGQDVGTRLTNAARSLQFVADHCRHSGLTLALETPLPHLIGGQPDEFAWILNRVDSARVCLDTGHTTLGGSWRRFVELAGPRLVHVHASDNHGERDDHLPPGDGRIDWREIVTTLSDAHFEGWIMLELARPAGDVRAYFTRALERAHVVLAPPAPVVSEEVRS